MGPRVLPKLSEEAPTSGAAQASTPTAAAPTAKAAQPNTTAPGRPTRDEIREQEHLDTALEEASTMSATELRIAYVYTKQALATKKSQLESNLYS